MTAIEAENLPALGDIEYVLLQFSRTFLGGVPLLLNDGGALLSFICILSGTEALAGYRFPEISQNGERFRSFIGSYFPSEYGALGDQLWKLRNSLVHAFSPNPFGLCHHQAHVHLMEMTPGVKTLNAENFYAALVQASAKYFAELRSSTELQAKFRERMRSADGGAPLVVVTERRAATPTV